MTAERPAGRIETLNGVEVYYEVHGAGEPLFLLHGFLGCSQDWAALIAEWRDSFQLIVPDMRGHGRSSNPAGTFRHDEAAGDLLALLDHLQIARCKGLGVSGGGNVLLHVATRQPARVEAMVLVSATSHFPPQARPIMRSYPDHLTEDVRNTLRQRHPGGDPQIQKLLANAQAFADSYDDLNFTPPQLAAIQARTLIVQGDRDPFYPVEISVEMARAIPRSSLWIVPHGGHGPIGGAQWPDFVKTAYAFLHG
jgi:pimeloyl-ACP methyl ester carboxylesterase